MTKRAASIAAAILLLVALQGCASARPGHPARRPLLFLPVDGGRTSDSIRIKIPDAEGSIEILGSSRHISASVYELDVQIGVYWANGDSSSLPELHPGDVALTMGGVAADTTLGECVRLQGSMPYAVLTSHRFFFSSKALRSASEPGAVLAGVLELSRCMRRDDRFVELPSIRVIDPLFSVAGGSE